MPFITVNRIKMYYEQHGEGDNHVVLIGGVTADHFTWVRLLGRLAKKFRVLVFDNRGAGQTDAPTAPPYSSQLMANDTVELMKALGIESAHIVGHSLGGHIAQWIAVNCPQRVKKLVICSSKAYSRALPRFRQDVFFKLMQAGVDKKTLIANTMLWLFSDEFFCNSENVENFIKIAVDHPHPQTAAGYEGQAFASLNHDTRGVLHLITMPTLVISGADDIYTAPINSEYLANHIPNAQLRLIKNCGHIPQLEKPDEVLELLLHFL